ncbi:MAG: hypothetical protein U0Q19_06935 [Kineosporiaceae bacterium]
MAVVDEPRWAKPAPLGYAASADAAHFVAAPLLASGCLAMIGVVGADGEKFRWPAWAMLLLACAAMCLVGSIQYGFHARALLYSAADVDQWWGSVDAARLAEDLQNRQRQDFARWQVRIARAVLTYNVGVALLGGAMALCLAPPTEAASPRIRWIAALVMALGASAELVWAAAHSGWQGQLLRLLSLGRRLAEARPRIRPPRVRLPRTRPTRRPGRNQWPSPSVARAPNASAPCASSPSPGRCSPSAPPAESGAPPRATAQGARRPTSTPSG